MRVLLLRPVPDNDRFGLGPFFRIEPLGMEYIASALEARGHDVTIADLRFSRPVEQYLSRLRPGLVGIAGMHALETNDVLALAARVRRAAPGVPLIIGGHSAAAYPGPFLSPNVNAVVVDDGERAVPLVTEALEKGRALRDVPGLAVADPSGMVCRTQGETGTLQLDEVPRPARHQGGHVGASVRVPRPSADLTHRDGARVPVPLFGLLDLAAATTCRARALYRVCL